MNFCDKIPLPISRPEPAQMDETGGISIMSLPVEILENIFRQLNFKQLQRVCQVCHRWRQCVHGSPALMSRFCLRFPKVPKIDHDFEPGKLVPASKAILQEMQIVVVDSWWPNVGSKLTEIQLESCSISMETLLNMLKHTPNLKSLQLDSEVASSNSTSTIDFRLEKLERLRIHHMTPELLDIFTTLNPLLRYVGLHSLHGKADSELFAYFLRTIQTTLEQIEIYQRYSGAFLDVTRAEQLRLKRLSTKDARFREHNLREICRQQPSLEELNIALHPASVEALRDVGLALPNLKLLAVRVDHRGTHLVPSFLAHMPNLRSLFLSLYNVRPFRESIDLSHCSSCPLMLKELQLHDFRFGGKGLEKFLLRSPRMESVCLTRYDIKNSKAFFKVLNQLSSLERLILKKVKVANDYKRISPAWTSNVKYLRVEACPSLSREMLTLMFRNWTKLEEVHLIWTESFDDELCFSMHQELKYLKALHVEHCSVTDRSVDFIRESCPEDVEIIWDGDRALLSVKPEGYRFQVNQTEIQPSANLEVVQIGSPYWSGN